MRFTLTYRGPLPTRGSPREKSDLRRQLHPQLKELWTHRPLMHHREDWLREPDAESPSGGKAWRETGGRRFVVIVMERFNLTAELDVLLLRPQYPGAILQNADIDNRLKTLFDALQYPSTTQKLDPQWTPEANEQPLFCLLEDDGLITRVTVDTDRLLDARSPDEVVLTIRVKIRATSPTYASIGLIS